MFFKSRNVDDTGKKSCYPHSEASPFTSLYDSSAEIVYEVNINNG